MFYLLAKKNGKWHKEAEDTIREILVMECASLLEDRVYRRDELKIVSSDNLPMTLTAINHRCFYAY